MPKNNSEAQTQTDPSLERGAINYPMIMSEKISQSHWLAQDNRQRQISTELMEKYYGFIEFELETPSYYECFRLKLNEFKVQMNQKVYNGLEEPHKEG